MSRILSSKSYYYNDVNLIADKSSRAGFFSRKEIPEERFRIIVSPMESLIGESMVVAAAKAGLSIALHRFGNFTPTKQIELYKTFRLNALSNKQLCFCSVGINNYKEWLPKFKDAGIKSVGVDTANGYMRFETMAEDLSLKFFDEVYVGNVHTLSGCLSLEQELNRPLFIRVGIGGGSPCSSSDVTGINRGQITELQEISDGGVLYKSSRIIADGGIKNSGYAAKAFAAGAQYIMMGGYFNSAAEAETNIVGDGEYWGGASQKQLDRNGFANKHSEGKIIKITQTVTPLKLLADNLWAGLSSYVSYSGYSSLSDCIGNGIFEVKCNSLPPKDRK